MKNLFILLPFFFLLSCSLAPFRSIKTARTIGKDNWQVDAGQSPTIYVSGSLGLTRNFDMGMTIEQQFGPVFEIFGKYALINSRNNGLSLAAYGGGYQGGGTRGYHIGPALSLKLGWFETYFVASYKGGAWEGEHTSVEDDDNVFKLKSGVYKIDFNYLQYSTGINLWFSQEFALNISAKRLYFYGTETDNSNDVVVPGWSLIWRF